MVSLCHWFCQIGIVGDDDGLVVEAIEPVKEKERGQGVQAELGGAKVRIAQVTRYPLDGAVELAREDGLATIVTIGIDVGCVVKWP